MDFNPQDESKPLLAEEDVLELLKHFTEEESEFVKKIWGIGYPYNITISDIAKEKKKNEDDLKNQLIDIERRLYKMLKEKNIL